MAASTELKRTVYLSAAAKVDLTAGVKGELTAENLAHWMVALLEQLKVV